MIGFLLNCLLFAGAGLVSDIIITVYFICLAERYAISASIFNFIYMFVSLVLLKLIINDEAPLVLIITFSIGSSIGTYATILVRNKYYNGGKNARSK
jgi:hypothetical protein